MREVELHEPVLPEMLVVQSENSNHVITCRLQHLVQDSANREMKLLQHKLVSSASSKLNSTRAFEPIKRTQRSK